MVDFGIHEKAGIEDSLDMYPHSSEPLKGNGPVIDAIVSIARKLGKN
jgi:hypothetical protein